MRVVLVSSLVWALLLFVLWTVGVSGIAGFVSGSLGGLDPTSESFDPDEVRETASSLAGMYETIINDIASFQTDPDYERAEAKRQEWVGRAETLADFFKDLADEQQARLEGLQAEAAELEASAETSP